MSATSTCSPALARIMPGPAGCCICSAGSQAPGERRKQLGVHEPLGTPGLESLRLVGPSMPLGSSRALEMRKSFSSSEIAVRKRETVGSSSLVLGLWMASLPITLQQVQEQQAFLKHIPSNVSQHTGGLHPPEVSKKWNARKWQVSSG